jgi:hypothetical protein
MVLCDAGLASLEPANSIGIFRGQTVGIKAAFMYVAATYESIIRRLAIIRSMARLVFWNVLKCAENFPGKTPSADSCQAHSINNSHA